MKCVLRIVVLAVMLLARLLPADALGEAGNFLVISDFHFDPFQGLNRQEFAELQARPVAAWPAFFAERDLPLGKLGTDSSARLVDSALAAAAKQLPEPSFILYPGDFLAHDWQRKYNALAAHSLSADAGAYRD